MWDALHFLLTGKSATSPIIGNCLSEAIMGQINLTDEGSCEFYTGISSARVCEIAKTLQAIDFSSYLADFRMEAFAANDIYPSIWTFVEEQEEIKEDLSSCFETLKNFYSNAVQQSNAILVSIC